MREKIRMISERYRSDNNTPSCVWDWDENEVCQYYEIPGRCTLLDRRVPGCNDVAPPLDGCPFWADDVEVIDAEAR